MFSHWSVFFNGAYWCVSLQKCVHTSGPYWVRSCEGQSWFCKINPSYDVMVLEVIEIWHWALTSYYLQHPIRILLWTQWLIYLVLQMYGVSFCRTAVVYRHDSPGDKLYYVWFIFSWLIPMPGNGFHGFHGKGATHLIVWDFIHFVVQENVVFLNCHTEYITFIRYKRPQHQMWNVRACHIDTVCFMAVMNKEEMILNSCF